MHDAAGGLVDNRKTVIGNAQWQIPHLNQVLFRRQIDSNRIEQRAADPAGVCLGVDIGRQRQPQPVVFHQRINPGVTAVVQLPVVLTLQTNQTTGVEGCDRAIPGRCEDLLKRLRIDLYIPFGRRLCGTIVANEYGSLHADEAGVFSDGRIAPESLGDVWHRTDTN